MSDSQQVDMSRPATITLPLFQWNAVLGCLRTGTGAGFTWEMTNPLIQTIGQQLQQQMFRNPLPAGLGAKPNGEDTSEGGAESRAHNEGVQRRRPPLWEQNRAAGEE